MRIILTHDTESDRARNRLLRDQALRPITEQRVRLALLSVRFERVARVTLIEMLGARARQDPRYALVLQSLLRMKTE